MSTATAPTAPKPPAAPKPPVLAHQTTAQTWVEGEDVSFKLPANTFTAPANETLHYTATLADGQALPKGLSFDGQTGTFSGTAPISAETLGVNVTATSTSKLSVTETFAVHVVAAPPTLAHATVDQKWTPGHSMSFVLPANTFGDASGGTLSYQAYETTGADQTTWLHFNAATHTFSGMVPAKAAGFIGITVVATNAAHLTVSDTFGVAFGAAAAPPPASIRPTEMIAIHPATT